MATVTSYLTHTRTQYIGSLEIARPTSKVDIITAMRRIRVSMCVCGGGVLVSGPQVCVYVYSY